MQVLLNYWVSPEVAMTDVGNINFKQYSDRWYAALYLKHGSVDSALDSSLGRLPISVAEYHRLVRRSGIVKGNSGRRNGSFAQELYVFLHRALKPKASLEKIFFGIPLSSRKARMPQNYYRIYDHIIRGDPRRLAVGAIITPEDNPTQILITDERETVLSSAKTKGQATIPFGFASRKFKGKHKFDQSLLRVLQREFSSDLALRGQLALEKEDEKEEWKLKPFARRLIPEGTAPFLEFEILDIKLLIAHIRLPRELCDLSVCSSYTVQNHRFEPLSDLVNGNSNNLRPGIEEVLRYYQGHLATNYKGVVTRTSSINKVIAACASEGLVGVRLPKSYKFTTGF